MRLTLRKCGESQSRGTSHICLPSPWVGTGLPRQSLNRDVKKLDYIQASVVPERTIEQA